TKSDEELLYFFFFQAEDGIRDKLVTGVQTCALPISRLLREPGYSQEPCGNQSTSSKGAAGLGHAQPRQGQGATGRQERARDARRSEERRVGKECRSRWSQRH